MLTLIIGVTIAILLASIISTVIMFAVLLNTKCMRWLVMKYIKMLEKIAEDLDLN